MGNSCCVSRGNFIFHSSYPLWKASSEVAAVATMNSNDRGPLVNGNAIPASPTIELAGGPPLTFVDFPSQQTIEKSSPMEVLGGPPVTSADFPNQQAMKKSSIPSPSPMEVVGGLPLNSIDFPSPQAMQKSSIPTPMEVVGGMALTSVDFPSPQAKKKSHLPSPIEVVGGLPLNFTAPSPKKSPTVSVLGRTTENLREVYTLGKKLGQGQFGTTYLCIERATGEEYACKSISKRKLLSEEDVDDVRREIQIMHHLSGHPNVVAIRGAYEDPTHVHLVMELCAGGELFDRIIKRGHFSEKKAAELTRTIIGVIETCHSLGVMHRDLKPENFLFANRNEDSVLKTIDFGLSIFFKPGEIYQDVVGSPYYVAPEVLRKCYGPKADVWSCGVIMYILLSGVPPFWAETEQGIFEQVLHGELDFDSDPWPHISGSAKDLIKNMLNRNPNKRFTAHEALCHPWIREDGVAPDNPIDISVLSRMRQFLAMNKMKKIALRVIAEHLSEEEIAGLKEMFIMMDTDNSGAITFDELRDGLRKLGSRLMDTEIRTIMEAADVDNNGSIDYGEFIAATLHLNKMEHEDNLFAAFSYFDRDGSGYITVDELQEACLEHNMGDAQIEEIIREIDQNNDGKIDYSEFSAMMRKGSTAGRRTMRNSFQTGLQNKMLIG